MLQSLLSAIAEMLPSVICDTVVKFLNLENVIEFVTALFGLACIVIGFVIWWSGP
jgi:hypothetical protein